MDHVRLEKEVINSEHREASRPASSPAEDHGASGMELLQCGEERCWGAGGALSDILEGKSLRGKKSHLGPNCSCGDAVFLPDPVSELLT